MRKLTITREKSFVASLAKMKIYIEDPEMGDLPINGVPCRKLGDLKNGETVSFEVSKRALKVYVISDKLSKDYSNDFVVLPEGDEEVVLSGKNRFNPAAGNAFRFNGNENEQALKNRKKGARIGIVVLIVAAIVGFGIGFIGGYSGGPSGEAKTFTSNGMTITLTDEFEKVSIEGMQVSYDSPYVAVFAIREPFSMIEGFEDYTLTEYGKLVLEANGMSDYELITKDGLTYFIRNAVIEDTNENFVYFSVVYKADDAFWFVQFAVRSDNYAFYEEDIVKWAKSVSFT